MLPARSSRVAPLCAATLFLLLSTVGAVPAAAQAGAGASAGVQEYYLPGTQAELLGLFNQVLLETYGADAEGHPNACVSVASGVCLTTATPGWEDLIESRVSLVAYDRSTVLLDDDADGYVPEADRLDPSKYQGSYELDRGAVRTFWQTGRVEIPGVAEPSTSPFAVKGGDRIVTVGGPVFVVRTAWPKHLGRLMGTSKGQPLYGAWGDGQVLADCLPLYPTVAWGRQYGSPMGVGGAGLHVDDLVTKAVVQARENGTVVKRNGLVVNPGLAQGQSHVIEAVNVGDLIEASAPVQVALVTSGKKTVDTRFFNLTPEGLLGADYVFPVNATRHADGSAMNAALYLFAHGALDYQVFQGDTLVASGSLPAKGTAVVPVPPAGGPSLASEVVSMPGAGPEDLELSPAIRVVAAAAPGAPEPKLQVLLATDSDSPNWDWGLTAVSTPFLLSEYYVPWAPAKGPAWPLQRYQGFGSPLHITPAADQTLVEIDWDPWADNGWDYSRVLDAGEWAMVSDPDGDNSGARIRGVKLGNAAGGASPAPDGALAVAWGESLLADEIAGYDFGYTVLPQGPALVETSLLLLKKTVTPSAAQAGAVAPGGLFHVALELTAGPKEVQSIRLSDTLPTDDFAYVPGTAVVTFPDGSSAHVEPVPASGLFLQWDLASTLPAGQRLVVQFEVLVDVDYGFPLPDTRVNRSNAYGRWCPAADGQCLELKVESSDEMTVDLAAAPAIDVETLTNGQDADTPPGPTVAVGSTVTWAYVVVNTGNVSLTSVGVTDDKGVAVSCPKAALQPGESMTCTATGTAVAGQYANVGTAAGGFAGTQVSDSDPSHYFGGTPAIDVETATNGHDADVPPGPYIAVGQVVVWTYRVTNTGTVPLTGVAVTDDQGVAVSCPKTALAPGDSMTCTATGTAEPGQHRNVGTAAGSHETLRVSDSDPSHYYGATPAIDVETATNGQDADLPPGPYVAVGSTVTWTYAVTNTGELPLSNVRVLDDRIGPVACPKAQLAVGESMTCTARGKATAGQYANVGTASGSYNVAQAIDTDPSHYFGAAPAVDVETLTNGEDADVPTGPVVKVGSTVTWTYVVANTGNVPLTNVKVTDDRGVVPVCPAGWNRSLAVGQSVTCSATGKATAGQYSNLGTVVAQSGATVVKDSDPSHYFGQAAGGCTRSAGYWATHWSDGPNYDPTWAGYRQNGLALFFDEEPVPDLTSTGLNYIQMLRAEPRGSAYIILAHAFIAAELNVEAGAEAPPLVRMAMAKAAALLAYDDYEARRDIPKSKKGCDRETALGLAFLLDLFNKGLIGPGCCK